MFLRKKYYLLCLLAAGLVLAVFSPLFAKSKKLAAVNEPETPANIGELAGETIDPELETVLPDDVTHKIKYTIQLLNIKFTYLKFGEDGNLLPDTSEGQYIISGKAKLKLDVPPLNIVSDGGKKTIVAKAEKKEGEIEYNIIIDKDAKGELTAKIDYYYVKGGETTIYHKITLNGSVIRDGISIFLDTRRSREYGAMKKTLRVTEKGDRLEFDSDIEGGYIDISSVKPKETK